MYSGADAKMWYVVDCVSENVTFIGMKFLCNMWYVVDRVSENVTFLAIKFLCKFGY